MSCKHRVPIRDYTLWEVMQLDNIIEEKMSHMCSITSLAT